MHGSTGSRFRTALKQWVAAPSTPISAGSRGNLGHESGVSSPLLHKHARNNRHGIWYLLSDMRSHLTFRLLSALVIGLVLTPVDSLKSQDNSVLCSEFGDCQTIWISELGYALQLPPSGLRQDHNFTWEFGLLQPVGDGQTGVGGTTYVGVDLSGNTRVGLKARQRTQLSKIVLDIGIGALLFDSRGSMLGATVHIGVGVNRHVSLKLSADVVDRPGGALGVLYAGVNVTKLSGRLSPIEGILGGLLPLVLAVVGSI